MKTLRALVVVALILGFVACSAALYASHREDGTLPTK